jgi:hypothetical protein
MSDGRLPEILEAPQARIRSFANFANGGPTRRRQCVPDSGGKSDILDERVVRNFRRPIKHRSRDCLAGHALSSKALKVIRHLFCVALRSQPSNPAIAIHPVINIGFAFKAGNFPGINARILSHNMPVVL